MPHRIPTPPPLWTPPRGLRRKKHKPNPILKFLRRMARLPTVIHKKRFQKKPKPVANNTESCDRPKHVTVGGVDRDSCYSPPPPRCLPMHALRCNDGPLTFSFPLIHNRQKVEKGGALPLLSKHSAIDGRLCELSGLGSGEDQRTQQEHGCRLCFWGSCDTPVVWHPVLWHSYPVTLLFCDTPILWHSYSVTLLS